jgi:hypothetical protein
VIRVYRHLTGGLKQKCLKKRANSRVCFLKIKRLHHAGVLYGATNAGMFAEI